MRRGRHHDVCAAFYLPGVRASEYGDAAGGKGAAAPLPEVRLLDQAEGDRGEHSRDEDPSAAIAGGDGAEEKIRNESVIGRRVKQNCSPVKRMQI